MIISGSSLRIGTQIQTAALLVCSGTGTFVSRPQIDTNSGNNSISQFNSLKSFKKQFVLKVKIWFQNRRTKWKKQDPSTAAELAQLKSASRSSSSSQQQQQHQTSSMSGGKAGSSADPSGLGGPTDEEAHSDASSPSGPSSPL